MLTTNADHEEAWRRYFTENDIQPFHVIYEDLTTSYEQTALEILQYLHIDIPERILLKERRMKKQADALSEGWVRLLSHTPRSPRFVRGARPCPRHPSVPRPA